MRRRSTGRTSPRTISPAPRPRSGCRCARDGFYSEERHRPAAEDDVAGIDARSRKVRLADGSKLAYDRLLLATGAEPVRLVDPGRRSAPRAHAALARRLPRDHRARRDGAPRRRDRRELHRARSRRRRCARATSKSTSSRRRSGRWSGCSAPQMGDFVRALHEEHGVVFHLEDTVTSIDGQQGELNERRLARCRSRGRRASVCARGLALAEKAGPDHRSRRRRQCLSRNERAGDFRGRRHRALARSAQRRVDSRRALGGRGAPGPGRGAQHARPARDSSPPCRSSGASTTTCRSIMSATPRPGTISSSRATSAKDCVVRFNRKGRTLAVASIYRDVESLQAEIAMERAAAAA